MPNTTQNIATNKIIFALVFICAALMTSLFVYHASQKPMTAIKLPPEIGINFPVAKDIKSFELLAANKQKFTEKDFYNHWTLLFFGFTHCASVCPMTLDVMKRTYAELHAKYPDLQVVLVSVDPERDSSDTLINYVKSYHPDFTGITGKVQEIRKLQSQLGVYSARDNTEGNNYQIQHTSSIFLINPQGKWAGLFKFGLKPDDLKKGIEASIKDSHG